MTTYYKVLEGNQSKNGGTHEWSLPVLKDNGEYTAGKWQHIAKDREIQLCATGFHVVEWDHIAEWLSVGCSIYEAEVKGDTEVESDEVAARSCRLLKPVAAPEWWVKVETLVQEIKEIRYFEKRGQAKPEWRVFAGSSWYAARNAARNAAREAAWYAARNAAREAAWNAAWNAARNAAWNAARDAARNAAWDATGDAAGNAAWSAAGNVAWDAAWNVAWNAAGEAAWDAALYVALSAVCADLNIDEVHFNHVAERMAVWRAGYGLLCDVDGVLYVYAKE